MPEAKINNLAVWPDHIAENTISRVCFNLTYSLKLENSYDLN